MQGQGFRPQERRASTIPIGALRPHPPKHSALSNYSNVHQDVQALLEWTVLEKDEAARVFVPWDEIAVRWPLVKKAA